MAPLLVFLWLLASFGLTMIIGFSQLLSHIRAMFPHLMQVLVRCPQCTGFWIGVCTSVTLFSPWQDVLALPAAIRYVVDGCTVSGSNLILYSIVSWLNQASFDIKPFSPSLDSGNAHVAEEEKIP